MNCPISFFESHKQFIRTETLKDNLEFIHELSTTPLLELNSQITNKDKINKSKSEKYRNDLISSFELFDISTSDLIGKVINTYLQKKEKQFLLYEDFLVLFCSILKYYSSLNISIRLFNSKYHILLILSGNEAIYESLAQFFEYDLQLKPYALMYELERNNSAQNIHPDINSPIYYPPYYHFHKKYENCYKCYYPNDDDYYELEEHIPERVSKFRAIDKLRLIYYITDYLVKFTYLFNQKIIFSFIYRRNNKDNKEHFSHNFIQPNVPELFNSRKCEKRISFLRNYFCEEVAMYFLWLDNCNRWLIIPCLFAIFLSVLKYFHKENEFQVKIIFITINSNEFYLLLYGIAITLWATLFHKIWMQKEKLYSYIWGMDSFGKNDPINENFIPESDEEFIFGYKNIKQKTLHHKFKIMLSYIILLLMICITVLIIFTLFTMKKILTVNHQDSNYNFILSCAVAVMNAVQIKVMKFIYGKIAKNLNIWENHYKIKGKENSLALKLILFDFMNNYSSFFYIAFIKPYNEGCIENDCIYEIKTQLYTIFIVFFCFNILEIIIPIMKSQKIKEQLRIIEGENEHFKIQSIEHIMSLVKVKSMHDEYNNIIILFGFVCFFTVIAPLISILAFFLAYLSRLIDHYKFYHLVKVDFVNGAKGIGKYNKIIRAFIFVGAMVNIGIVLFTRKDLNVGVDRLKNKLILFGTLESLIFCSIYFINWKILPDWFSQIQKIKELYFKKYLFKETDLLTLNLENKNKYI